MRFPSAALVAGLIMGVAVAGCAPLRSHQGYVIDADLVNSVQPGVDTRQSVAQVLGQPSVSGQFAPEGQGDWYYVARDSRNYAFNPPKAVEQLTMQISFDAAGNVSAIRKSGVEQVASISPSKKVTPTLGRSRSFFSELFGNIGAVGTAGGAQGGNGRAGGRDQP